MILTCKQDQSRNYQFGKLIADQDISIEDAKSMVGTVEGYDCCITLVDKDSSRLKVN
jgi:glycerol-3-phosphate dehydrogenase